VKLYIEGIPYEVYIKPDLIKHVKCLAVIDREECTIFIDEKVPLGKRVQSLLHEIMEVIFPWPDGDTDINHDDFDVMARRLFGILCENGLLNIIEMEKIVSGEEESTDDSGAADLPALRLGAGEKEPSRKARRN